MLLSRAEVEDVMVLARFEMIVARFWRSSKNCATYGPLFGAVQAVPSMPGTPHSPADRMRRCCCSSALPETPATPSFARKSLLQREKDHETPKGLQGPDVDPTKRLWNRNSH